MNKQEKITWEDTIIEALVKLAKPSHRSEIYEEVRNIRKSKNLSWPPKSKETIQRELQNKSSDSSSFDSNNDDLFGNSDKGKGIWYLRPNVIEKQRYKEFGIKNPWWIEDSEEHYWLEILKVDSNDRFFDPNDKKKITIGKQIWAPHFAPNSPSKRVTTYSLVNFVNKGDVVYHYISEERAIVGYSYAKDYPYDDMEYWASKENVKKPVFKVDLENFIPFENPVTLDYLRQKQNKLIDYLSKNPDIKYAPFHKGKNMISEGYLSKFPKEFIRLLNLNTFQGNYSLEDKIKTSKAINSYNRRRKQKKEIIENPYDGTFPSSDGKNKKLGKGKGKITYFELALSNRFETFMKNKGFELSTLEIGEYENDIYIHERDILIEAKATTSAANLRMVIGQIKHYDYLLSKENKKPKYLATLLPDKPDEDFKSILSNEQIYIIWETNEGFFENNLPDNFFHKSKSNDE